LNKRKDPKTTNDAVEMALESAVELGEIGIQVAAYVGDELVIDSWTGDARTGVAVDAATLFPVLSVSKAVTAVALHIQAERGLVDYDAPVALYWPEFGVKGKEHVTILHVLTHQSGVPGMPPATTPELMANWDWMVNQLAMLDPLCPPGTKNTYATYSFGWILGEVVRRTDPMHRPFDSFVREEITEPLGIDDLWIGLPPAQEHRVATLVGPFEQPTNSMRKIAVPDRVPVGPDLFNQAIVHQACIPSASGIANARAVARFFAMLANGGRLGRVRLLSESRVRLFTTLRPHSYDKDDILDDVALVGNGGLWLSGRDPVVGKGPNILYHTGGGGTYGWADLDTRVAVGICHNRMFTKATAHAGDGTKHPFSELGKAIRSVAAPGNRTPKARALPE